MTYEQTNHILFSPIFVNYLLILLIQYRLDFIVSECQSISMKTQEMPYFALAPVAILLAVLLSGCSFFISSATLEMADNLSQTILNSNDLETVEAGAPAYLLMLDSMLERNPEDEPLLRTAANIYTAYADVFVQNGDRAKKMTDKSLDYALRAVCVHDSSFCSIRSINFKDFKHQISQCRPKDVPALFTLGSSWAAWIRSHRDDWNAVAEIARVEAVMQRVVEIDEFYQGGAAHVYLGILASFLPPALGGRLDVGRQHFERALEISGQKNLMIKVLYANQYARMAYDRDLHDRLLHEVIAAEPNVPGYVLSNTLAQQKAQELLDSADEYF